VHPLLVWLRLQYRAEVTMPVWGWLTLIAVLAAAFVLAGYGLAEL
jgi:hypothetical protein